MSEKKVGLIIGGNRGIGKALVESLASHWGEAGRVYLTARQQADALAAKAEVEARTGHSVGALVFDLASSSDAARVSQELHARYGGVDVVVQNGAYLPRAGRPAVEDARPMVQANSHGTLRVLQAFTPVLNANGRLLIVASALGVLHKLPEKLRPLFDTRRQSPEQINQAIDGYVDAVEAGRADELGWPKWVNIPSKVAQVAITRSFARRARAADRLPTGATINAACPGVTLTDATKDFMGTVFKQEDAQSPEAAAAGLMSLLNVQVGSDPIHGELIQFGEVINFGD